MPKRTKLASNPGSLETSLLEFFHRLRDARVPVSMVEVLDAFDCLRHVDLADRAQFRAALAATLIKRAEDRSTFDVLFDVCFPLTRSQPAAPARGNRETAGGEPVELPEPDGGGEASTELLQALLEALRDDDEAAMAALAGLAIDTFGGMEGQREGTERYFMYRILRQLELYRLIQMAMAERLTAQGTGADLLDARLERERLERRLEEFRRMLAERVRHRLAARVASPRRRRNRGRLDVRRTLRRSVQYGGVPVEPAFRARHATRPDLFVLADVSGSVVEFAEFSLSLLYAMSQELGRLRSFAFVDGIDELTGLLASSECGLDLRATFARAKEVDDDGHSHYGQVLERFAERYGGDIDGRSTLIVMGDARANYRDAGADALRRLRARARRLYWLNPEPRAEWDSTDSVMRLYAPHCDRVFEVRNL